MTERKRKTMTLLFFVILSLVIVHVIEAYSTNPDVSGRSIIPGIQTDRNPGLLRKPNDDTSSTRPTSKTTIEDQLETPVRELKAPFPNGLNGGRMVTLPPSKHYDIKNGVSGNLILPPRDISVWLPSDYDKYPDMHFPVLYVHDGQNAMEDETSWTGYSWRIAGALTRLAERKLLKTTEIHSPPIVVLMPCAEDRVAFVPRRHLEYGDISQIFAQAHADFVAKTLKPLIDDTFRTMPEKENTGVIGSSLGGQASLHLLLRHPNLFGKAACMSPAFQPSILTSVATVPPSKLQDMTIYIDNGGDHEDEKVKFVDPFDHLSSNHWWNPGYWWLDSQLQPGIDAMKLALDLKNVKYDYKKIAGGRHNERAWALRIDQPLLSMFGR